MDVYEPIGDDLPERENRLKLQDLYQRFCAFLRRGSAFVHLCTAAAVFLFAFGIFAVIGKSSGPSDWEIAIRNELLHRNFENHATVLGEYSEDPAAIIVEALKRDQVLIGASTAVELYIQFNDFNRDFKRHDNSISEKIERFATFYRNVTRIREFNMNVHKTYTMKINQFADMTPEQFMSLQGTRASKIRVSKGIPDSQVAAVGNQKGPNLKSEVRQTGNRFADISPEDFIDLRKDNYMTPVKDQGNCGSCWAFSLIGVAEPFFKHKRDIDVVLSEQNLVDCVKECHGCDYGNSYFAYEYIRDHGVYRLASYPYTAKSGPCVEPLNEPRLTISRFGLSENPDLPQLLKQYGPLTVYVAVNVDWQFYSSGILDSCADEINHAVVLAGVGQDDDGPFWLIKNSWGTSWGEEGYVRLARGSSAFDNECGLAHMALYASA
ncbi:Papain cysteine protease family protein [Babesia bovis T2Bo]|uniref:Papain family cysteine protease containing protein n=1 Tax=Babesia bovis TaxID=5865 RepID=A7APS9_BABBO|nr:Papain cysteine protease family protein [Babesia bovis T2Bo]EDO08563.1 Papain cysteine protease family protein [Babesia bovis T2Bo]|eukprot:XP_001612131.1 papain family cysteine protease containing protein [Babesia bovis T2Bo]